MSQAGTVIERQRVPDRRALKILCDTFWEPSGWKRDRQTDPAEFAYAAAAGLMFEPRSLSHDEAVSAAVSANRSVTARQVVSAFTQSLRSRRLDLRSALGSYAATLRLESHSLEPWRGSGGCAICGLYELNKVDRNVLNFERFKWGGVRHLDPVYAAFDLEVLNQWYTSESLEEMDALDQIIDRWNALPRSARAQQLADALRGLIPSNDPERRTVVGVLAIAGVLQPNEWPSMTEQYVTAFRRNDLHPGGRNDWDFPAFGWSGKDGIRTAAIADLIVRAR